LITKTALLGTQTKMKHTEEGVSAKETSTKMQDQSTKKTWIKPEMEPIPIKFIDFMLKGTPLSGPVV
jgi:hypothetical protein